MSTTEDTPTMSISCDRSEPVQTQIAYRCQDGKLQTASQELWYCILGDNRWEQWRNTTDWKPTGEDC